MSTVPVYRAGPLRGLGGQEGRSGGIIRLPGRIEPDFSRGCFGTCGDESYLLDFALLTQDMCRNRDDREYKGKDGDQHQCNVDGDSIFVLRRRLGDAEEIDKAGRNVT